MTAPTDAVRRHDGGMVRQVRQPIDTFIVFASLKTIRLPNRFSVADLHSEPGSAAR